MEHDLAKIFSYDPSTGVVTWREGQRRAGRPLTTVQKKGGYIRTNVDRREYTAHQIAFYIMTGQVPEIIDHINGITSDNRWANLRAASPAENSRNRKAVRGLKGATLHKKTGKFQAQIKIGDKNHYLGLFDTEREANAAYAGAAKILFGEFARAA